MNKLLFFYTILLAAFSMMLAYMQYTWFSAFVLCVSFVGFAMIVHHNNPKPNKDV
jgi:type IV secretory pathway TrbL component